MGVSNVYNQAKASAIAAVKANMSSSTKKASNSKPDYMKMTGSIFNAPGVKETKPTKDTTETIADLNTAVSLDDLSGKPAHAKKSFEDIDNVSDGEAAASSVEAQTDKVTAYSSQIEREKGVVNRYGSNAEKLDEKLVKEDKKFTASQAKSEAQLKSDNQKLEKQIQENDEIQKEIDDAQHELDGLLARNSFSMGGAQNGSGSTGSDNSARITELQTVIGSKVNVMQANGKVIYSLQRSQSRTLNSMNRTASSYIRTHQKTQKNIQSQQDETSGVIKTATTIEQYSMLTQVAGQALDYAGQGLIALGQAMGTGGFFGIGAAVGAALIATGQVMSKIGTVADMVGQYGQAAANLTKTVAYAAEGNLMGAMQSCASAVQSGAAAAQSTKDLKTNFATIDQKATEATNKIAANQIAKDQVNNMTQDQLNGMTKKEAKKAMASNLEEQFNKGGIDGVTSTHNQNGRLKQLKEAVKDKTTVDANGKTVTTPGIKSKTWDTTKANYQTNLKAALPEGYTVDADGTIKDASGQKVDLSLKENKNIKKTRNNVGKQAKTGFRNTASETAKKSSTDWKGNMEKFSQTLMSAAQMYMMFSSGGSMMDMSSMTGGGSMSGMGSMMGMRSRTGGYANYTSYNNSSSWRERNSYRHKLHSTRH